MLRNVFGKTVRDLRWPTFWVAVGLAVIIAYFAVLFPTYRKIFDLQSLLDKLPPAARALIGANLGDTQTLTGFLHIELFTMILPAVMVAFTAGIASGFTAAEESRGTIDVLLSYPVPRWRMVLEKYLALVVASFVAAAVMLVATVAGAAASASELPADRVAAALLMVVLMSLGFASAALFLSIWTGNRGLAVGVAIASLVAMYLVDSLAPVVDQLKAIQPLSIFRYYGGHDPLRFGVDLGDAAVLVGVAVVLLVASLAAFERRDLAA